MENRKVFFDTLKKEFSPELRKIGFKGNGQDFLRVENDVINVVNIQSHKYGGSCAVNLGLHLSFLPMNWTADFLNLAKIKEYECEFRARLAPFGRSDYWWDYDRLLISPERSARHLIKTFFKYGEPQFDRFDSISKIAAMFAISDFKKKVTITAFGYVSLPRCVLTLARIHRHLGELAMAREFAVFGLENIGSAKALQPQYEEILNTT